VVTTIFVTYTLSKVMFLLRFAMFSTTPLIKWHQPALPIGRRKRASGPAFRPMLASRLPNSQLVPPCPARTHPTPGLRGPAPHPLSCEYGTRAYYVPPLGLEPRLDGF
jgi:hypothetical protein